MYYEVRPERINGKVVKTRVFCQDGSELIFIRSDEGEIVREQSMGKYWIKDFDYAKIYRQVCAIFNSSKSRAEKIKVRTTKVKKWKSSKTFFTKEERLIKQAQWLYLRITNYKTKHSCTWTESAFEIVKALPNYPRQFGWLTEEERQWLGNLKNAGLTVLTEGWLEIRRWERTIEKKPKRVVLKVKGINSALRMQDHILEHYRIDRPNQKSELEMILPVIALRKELLIFEKRRLQTTVNRAATAIHGITRNGVFTGKPATDNQLFWIKESLFKILSNLTTVWLSPYWEQAEQAKNYLEQALGFLNRSVFDRAETNLLTAYDVLKTDRSHAG